MGTSIVSIFLGPTEYGSTYLRVVPATYSWRFYPGGPWTITQEVQFLLLVLFTGAFGSSVYALKSLGDYLGQAKLNEGWFTFYLIQPFEGSGSAFLLYLVIRGGFLGGTGTDLKAINIFGICAIAGLAGAFSDMAFAKLREVFETLFKPKEDPSGGMGPVNSSLKISTTSLPDGDFKNQVAYNQMLEPAGGVGPYRWSVSPNLPKGLTLDADHGTIGGIPAEATAKVRYTFTVTDSTQASASAEFEIAML